MKIKDSPKNMPGLRLVGEAESGRVSANFGPLKAGLITTHKTRDQALSELLSSLENVVDSLNYKSFTAYATLANATEALRAVVYDTLIDSAGTDD